MKEVKVFLRSLVRKVFTGIAAKGRRMLLTEYIFFFVGVIDGPFSQGSVRSFLVM